jgi:succinate dehydrogenase flavin-adding protein (antitoxin of CptAB toxin-antitoxin module)
MQRALCVQYFMKIKGFRNRRGVKEVDKLQGIFMAFSSLSKLSRTKEQ